ncbi:MAG: hypothetical protein ACI8XB_001127 [Patiriisocius sp.]
MKLQHHIAYFHIFVFINDMKKALSIFFLVFYLVFANGFLISAHYCGDKLISLEFMSTAESCCGDMGDEAGCCTNNEEVIFFDHEQQKQNLFSGFTVESVDLFTVLTDDLLSTIDFESKPEGVFQDLPPPHKISPIILNCSLTLYG